MSRKRQRCIFGPELCETEICEIFSEKQFQFNKETYYSEDEVFELPTDLKNFDYNNNRNNCTPYDFDQ